MARSLRGIYGISQTLGKVLTHNEKSIFLNVSGVRPVRLPVHRMKFPVQMRAYSSAVSLDQQFSDMQKQVTTLQNEPDNDMKLKLYALFKQSTLGKCNTKKPGALDFVGKAKWQAWDALQDMTQEEAKKQYVATVSGLLGADTAAQAEQPSAAQTGSETVPGLLVEKKPGYLQITLNRPDKRNALTTEMYNGVGDILKAAAKDDSTSFVVFRGAGDFYCSGNDLGNFAKYMTMNMSMAEMAKAAAGTLSEYISSYVEFPKPLVAVVNGPAVGIAVTVLGLFDLVYATDKATFHTPFSALGQAPEGCSTYTFPKIMGYARANQILMMNKKVSAQEAKELRLVSEVFPQSTFEQDVEKLLSEMATLPKLSLRTAKQGTRSTEIEILRKVNALECEMIQKTWLSEDCQKAIAAFFSKNKKSNL